MGRLWEIVLRRPPLVAPPELLDRPGLTFGFTTKSENEGLTVTAYGPDGRRLGRPLKGLSSSAQATLTRPASEATTASQLQRLTEAWTRACGNGATNAEVLTAFADAAAQIGGADVPSGRDRGRPA